MLTQYIGRRLLLLIPLILIISVISFVLIQLPPGDILNMEVLRLRSAGTQVSEEEVEALRQLYGLDKSMPEQYWLWITNILFKGNFGTSFTYVKSVSEIPRGARSVDRGRIGSDRDFRLGNGRCLSESTLQHISTPWSTTSGLSSPSLASRHQASCWL